MKYEVEDRNDQLLSNIQIHPPGNGIKRRLAENFDINKEVFGLIEAPGARVDQRERYIEGGVGWRPVSSPGSPIVSRGYLWLKAQTRA